MKSKARSISSRFAANAIFVAAAGTAAVAVAAAQQATSQPDAPRRVTTTRASDASIDARIDDALLKQGTADAVAAELASSDQGDPAVLAGLARASQERGDLAGALDALQALSLRLPGDVRTLSELAAVQEERGLIDGAARTLRDAIVAAAEGPARTALRLRLAILTLDTASADDGVRLLDEVVSHDPQATGQAGVIAYLAGQFDAATRYLNGAGDAAPAALRLLAGNAALRAGRPAEALKSFEVAAATLAQPADRRYATERLIAAHRAAGTLPQLADEWLAETDLPDDRQLGLATTLRELGRVPDLLAWWRREAAQPDGGSRVFSPLFTAEVLGAAQEAGLSDDVEAIAKSLLAREPAGEDQWLSVVLSALLRDGKADEADALFASRTAAAASDPAQLDRLGKLAKFFGRDTAAINAARAMRALGGGNAIRGMLLESSVLLRAGDAAGCVAVLREASDAAVNVPAAWSDVATAYETAGMEGDAIRLLQASVAANPDEAVLERLASLLIAAHRSPEATPILQALRQTGTSAATRAQAGQQLLDIALADKTLDKLIAKTRAALDAGTGTESDLSMLIDAYARQRKPAEAAEAIQRTTLLDETGRLNRLAVLYQRMGDLAKASQTLQELVRQDPATAVTTLERIASIELSRKQPAAASAAIAEIARRLGEGSASFAELMGGIFDRLKRPAQAAPYYRRALAADPANADGWLLWATAMSKAGRDHQAIGRLQVLANDAQNANLFSIAADGLLNLKAPPAALGAVRRAAVLRVAAAPQQALLFQVIGDLCDELNDAAGFVRALDADIAFDREERPQLLRELMEKASEKRLIAEATACGRSMLALGDDFPPQLFLELGEQLLVADRPGEASDAFARAIDVSSDDFGAPRAADLYEHYGYPKAALDLLSPLAARRPADVPLQATLARLDGLSGRPAAAFESYLALIELADRQIRTASAATHPSGGVGESPLPDLTPLIVGAIAHAWTSQEQASLLKEMDTLARARVEAAAAGGGWPADLDRVLRLARNACFALGRPDVADLLDQRVIDRWPDHAAFQVAALRGRVEAGLFSVASRFGATHPLAGPPPARLRLAAPLPTTLPTNVNADDAAIWLPRMLARGEAGAAETLLDAVPSAMPARRYQTLPTLIAAAVALHRDDVATRWAHAWMASPPALAPTSRAAATEATPPTSRPSSASSQELRTLVLDVWHVLPPAVRGEIVDRAIALSDGAAARPAAAVEANLTAIQLAAAEGVTFPGQLDAALRVARAWKAAGNSPAAGLPEIAAIFPLLPVADRPAFVRGAVEALPPEFRLAFLQVAVSGAPDGITGDAAIAIVDVARALPPRQALIWSTWFYKGMDQAVTAALADATLRAVADGPRSVVAATFEVAAAAALARNEPARADCAALEALSTIVEVLPAAAATRPDDSEPTTRPATAPIRLIYAQDATQMTAVRLAVATLSAGARERLLATIDARRSDLDGPGQRAWRSAVRSSLLDAAGRRGDALAALRDAVQAGADDATIQQAYVSRLIEDGRFADLVDAFVRPPALFSNALRQPLVNALEQLFRFSEIPPEQKKVGVSAVQPYNAIDFMTPRVSGDVKKLASQLRALLERLRSDGGARVEIASADVGGLAGLDATPTAAGPFGDVATWPGAIDDLYATLGTLPPAAPNSNAIVGILAIAARDPAAIAPVLERIDVRVAVGGVTASDRALLQVLASVPGVKLSPPLIEELWTRATCEPGDDPDFAGLAEVLAAQGDPRAAEVERWVAVRSRVRNVMQSSSTDRWPASSPPLPIGAIDAGSVAWFESQADAGQGDAAERDVARLRETGRVPSQDVRWALLWARLAANRGDLLAFRTRIDAAVEVIGRTQILRPAPIDLSRALPRQFADGATRGAIVDVLATAAERAAMQRPDDTTWTRSLAALGQRAVEMGETSRANQLLNAADALAERQGVGEHQLWVADLARLVDRPDLAWSIERRLLDERCLPATRIEPLLRHIETAGDVDEAHRLAVEAAKYCREPNVRKRAGVH